MLRPLSSRVVLAFVVAAAGLAAPLPTARAGEPALLPLGVAAGDVTQTSAVLWAAATAPGTVTFGVYLDSFAGSPVATLMGATTEVLRPAKATATGLLPGRTYVYDAVDAAGFRRTGTFRTPNLPTAAFGFRMGVSGDWRGELAPFPAVRNIPARGLDVFVALGDTIYADVASPAVPIPQAITLEEYRRKHAEIYTERFGLNTFVDQRAATATLATIDDHEVTNDFQGGAATASDPRFAGDPAPRINETALYRRGMQAFGEWFPTADETWAGTGDPRLDGKPKLLRVRTYGQDAAVIVTDARSFRDVGLPAVADPLNAVQVGTFLAQAFNPTRTFLGRPQLEAVKAALTEADAAGVVWKFVMVPEPTQNLGVLAASDRYEGYAAERSELLRHIAVNDIRNVVFVAADIHGTLVNNLTYQDAPFGPQLETRAFEISTGSGAYDAPFGPTIAGIAAALGIPGTLPLTSYLALPPATKEAYITGLINAQIVSLGYDPLGLEDSRIAATLEVGGYAATNTYGWTEFDIDAATGRLLVTTYGIEPYTAAQLAANSAAITARTPVVVSRFRVQADRACSIADIASIGGFAPADGELTVDDYTSFINAFAGDNLLADVVSIGGFPPPDGELTVDDYTSFLNAFAEGCD